MISIFVHKDQLHAVREIIASEDRLAELVDLHDLTQTTSTPDSNSLVIDVRGILQPIDWQNAFPPYLLSHPIHLEKEILLGLVFHLLGNSEKTWHYLEDYPALQFQTGIMTRLQYGYQISLAELIRAEQGRPTQDHFETYRLLHNAAISRHYGYLDESADFQEIMQLYDQALETAPNGEYKSFTAKHFATLLLDAGQLDQATKLLETTLKDAVSDAAGYGLKSVLTQVWMKQLVVPYDPLLLAKLKDTLWETLQYFEKNNRLAEAGLLLTDAAHIANISGSFAESLGYISKAIRIFEDEELEELAGNAQIRKGTLLYTWAQNGNPQFYKAAVESYQQALKIFRQDVAPDVFADIHHNLAVLYSEMPAENKKRSIWAGVSSASFQEALNYFTKDRFPYEYGMICNNFGNALTRYPLAVHTDNYEKALYYYQEALDVRTARYPYERALTLLNFLEASWQVSNVSDEFNEERYADMTDKAREVLTLVDDEDLAGEAKKHLEMLIALKQEVEK